MGKKIAIGCLSVFVLVLLVGGGFAYFKFVRPAQQAFTAAKQVAQFKELDREVRLKTTYAAPADGVLQPTQVERYLAVHEQIRAALKGKLEELDQRYDKLAEDGRKPSFADLARAWGDMAKLLVSVKRAQVDALNSARFSLSEYGWVRGQVLLAAGHSVTVVDVSTLGGSDGAVAVEDVDQVAVPPQNVELVRPVIDRLDTALALAAFGL